MGPRGLVPSLVTLVFTLGANVAPFYCGNKSKHLQNQPNKGITAVVEHFQPDNWRCHSNWSFLSLKFALTMRRKQLWEENLFVCSLCSQRIKAGIYPGCSFNFLTVANYMGQFSDVYLIFTLNKNIITKVWTFACLIHETQWSIYV